jgi:hypothetical protein
MKFKSKVKRKVNSKSAKLKHIKNYNFTLSNENINYLNNHYLINTDFLLKNKDEILLSPGTISVGNINNPFFINDPLSLSTVKVASGIISVISLCLTPVIINIYKNDDNKKTIDIIIKKKFKRLTKYFNINTDLSGDGMLQMKLLKYILNENILKIKGLPKTKIIKALDDLVEFRNLLSHNTHIKKDMEANMKDKKKVKQKTLKNRKTLFIKNNPLRNLNYIKLFIKKSQYLINTFYVYKKQIGLDISDDKFYIPYHIINVFNKTLDNLCILRERRHNMDILINNEQKVLDIAEETLDYLNKKLNNKNKKIKQSTARNIVNIITPRIESDYILKKHFNNKITNKITKKICKNV